MTSAALVRMKAVSEPENQVSGTTGVVEMVLLENLLKPFDLPDIRWIAERDI